MQESLSALLVPMVIFLMEVQYGDVHVTCSRSRELNDILLLPLHLQTILIFIIIQSQQIKE